MRVRHGPVSTSVSSTHKRPSASITRPTCTHTRARQAVAIAPATGGDSLNTWSTRTCSHACVIATLSCVTISPYDGNNTLPYNSAQAVRLFPHQSTSSGPRPYFLYLVNRYLLIIGI